MSSNHNRHGTKHDKHKHKHDHDHDNDNDNDHEEDAGEKSSSHGHHRHHRSGGGSGLKDEGSHRADDYVGGGGGREEEAAGGGGAQEKSSEHSGEGAAARSASTSLSLSASISPSLAAALPPVRSPSPSGVLLSASCPLSASPAVPPPSTSPFLGPVSGSGNQLGLKSDDSMGNPSGATSKELLMKRLMEQRQRKSNATAEAKRKQIEEDQKQKLLAEEAEKKRKQEEEEQRLAEEKRQEEERLAEIKRKEDLAKKEAEERANRIESERQAKVAQIKVQEQPAWGQLLRKKSTAGGLNELSPPTSSLAPPITLTPVPTPTLPSHTHSPSLSQSPTTVPSLLVTPPHDLRAATPPVITSNTATHPLNRAKSAQTFKKSFVPTDQSGGEELAKKLAKMRGSTSSSDSQSSTPLTCGSLSKSTLVDVKDTKVEANTNALKQQQVSVTGFPFNVKLKSKSTSLLNKLAEEPAVQLCPPLPSSSENSSGTVQGANTVLDAPVLLITPPVVVVTAPISPSFSQAITMEITNTIPPQATSSEDSSQHPSDLVKTGIPELPDSHAEEVPHNVPCPNSVIDTASEHPKIKHKKNKREELAETEVCPVEEAQITTTVEEVEHHHHRKKSQPEMQEPLRLQQEEEEQRKKERKRRHEEKRKKKEEKLQKQSERATEETPPIREVETVEHLMGEERQQTEQSDGNHVREEPIGRELDSKCAVPEANSADEKPQPLENAEAKLEPEPELEPQPQFDTQTQAGAEVEPEDQAQAEPETQIQTHAEAEDQARPEAEPKPEPEVTAMAQLETEVEVVSEKKQIAELAQPAEEAPRRLEEEEKTREDKSKQIEDEASLLEVEAENRQLTEQKEELKCVVDEAKLLREEENKKLEEAEHERAEEARKEEDKEKMEAALRAEEEAKRIAEEKEVREEPERRIAEEEAQKQVHEMQQGDHQRHRVEEEDKVQQLEEKRSVEVQNETHSGIRDEDSKPFEVKEPGTKVVLTPLENVQQVIIPLHVETLPIEVMDVTTEPTPIKPQITVKSDSPESQVAPQLVQQHTATHLENASSHQMDQEPVVKNALAHASSPPQPAIKSVEPGKVNTTIAILTSVVPTVVRREPEHLAQTNIVQQQREKFLSLQPTIKCSAKSPLIQPSAVQSARGVFMKTQTAGPNTSTGDDKLSLSQAAAARRREELRRKREEEEARKREEEAIKRAETRKWFEEWERKQKAQVGNS
ncbi:hypothetical protein Pelo_2452 [Pelomyxa schiedti]|nr:hypothetical protein Pelo_2452 [Pelomyxa schiedti]